MSSPPNIAGLALLVCTETALFAVVYGPMAAFLTEAFPPQLRYTSLSLPFNLGFGLLGGLLPLISLSLVSASGNVYAGLAYLISVVCVGVIVNLLFLRRQIASPASD